MGERIINPLFNNFDSYRKMIINPYRFAGGGGGGSNGLLTNLVSYWKLDEASGTRVDSHGSNDLTDNNTVGSAAGIISNAADFTEADSEYLSTTTLPVSSFPCSFSCWVKLDDTADEYEFLSLAKNSSPVVYIALRSPPSRGYELQVRSGGSTFDGSNFAAANGGTLSTDWTHVVAVISGSGDAKLYVDNVLVETDTNTFSWPPGMDEFAIGRIGDSSPGYSNCAVDEVGIWSRALSASDVTNLYNSGNGLAYESFTT